MSDYLIVGKKGTGKSKYAVQKIHDYLTKGKRVATNIDVDLAVMCRPMSRATVIRLPDKPTLDDLKMIGLGNEQVDEDLNGGLFLDECATWLNARAFNDKSRGGFLDFAVHGRKFGWDMYLMAQGIGQLDKQLRESLLEYVVRCTKLDRVKIPVVGGLLQALTFGKLGRLKLHYASTRLMEMPDLKIDGEYFRAKFYEGCYNTRQVFREWVRDPADPRFADEVFVGPYSVLSAWHLVGRYQSAPALSWFARLLGTGVAAQRPPRYPAKPIAEPVQRVLELLRKLPDAERIRHYKRLQTLGVI